MVLLLVVLAIIAGPWIVRAGGTGAPVATALPSPVQPGDDTRPSAVPPSAAQPGPDALSEAFLAEYDRLAAGDQASAPAVAEPTGTDLPSMLTTMLVSLAVIVGLIYGAVWTLQRTMGGQAGRKLPFAAGLDSKLLTIRESRQLSPSQKLHLVQMGDEVLLLGATDQTISCLARYPAQQFPPDFAQHLQSATRQKASPTGGPTLRPEMDPRPMPTLQESLEQLRRLNRQGRSDA